MTMLMLSVFHLLSAAAAGLVPWMLNLATRLLAVSLNMPEPLLRDTGVLLFARAQAVESSVGKTLCPGRLLRQFHFLLRKLRRIRLRRPVP
jgi:hypothetical protein